MDIQVIYEDNHLIAINKPPGAISQGDYTGDTPIGEIVKEYIKTKYNKPGKVFLGLVHRLDRPVGGVMVFARTSKALERLNQQFKERKVQKTYWAIVLNLPKESNGVLKNFVKRSSVDNRSSVVKKSVRGSKEAILNYELKGSINKFHFLEIKPQTGRHHQIRVQLSEIGCPICGDLKYGARRPNKSPHIHLHAASLEFIHPVKKEPLLLQAYPNHKEATWNLFAHFWKK